MSSADIQAVKAPAKGAPTLVAWAGRITWLWIWIGAIVLALLVHLAFLVAWPDHFIHEDGGAYLQEAEAILRGHYLDDPGKRPYGVAVFLVLLSKLFGPHILVFVIVQHLMSIGTALLVAATVRFAGAPRVLSVFAFLIAALYGRTVHYDNTIGAESISNFLVALASFVAAGIVFRRWSPLFAAAVLGLILGAVMTCRSATIGQASVILLWVAVMLNAGWARRLTVLALAGGAAIVVYLIPTAVDHVIGKHPAGNESLAVMAFVVGYSADYDRGVHLDRKAAARQFVEKMRAADTPTGWADGGVYQWPFEAIEFLRKPGDSAAEFEKAIRDIFIETLTTPSTLYRHVTKHFLREMYFLLFDGNFAARKTANPRSYEFMVHRDTYPFFGSPTGLKYRRLIYDYYKPYWRLEGRILPTADRIQVTLDYLLTLGYQPRSDLADLCCGLTISSEYDDLPGPIRWISAATLVLMVVLLASVVAARLGLIYPLPADLVAGGTLMILLALISAAFPAFLVYGLNRYAYYLIPFLGGASAILGAVLFDRIRLFVETWMHLGSRPAAGPAPIARK